MAWSRLLSCLAPFLAEISLLVLLLEMDLRLETVSKGVIGGNIKGGMRSHKIVVTARFEWKKRFFCCLLTPFLFFSAVEYFFYIVCLKAFLLFESSLRSSPVSRWVPKKELNKCERVLKRVQYKESFSSPCEMKRFMSHVEKSRNIYFMSSFYCMLITFDIRLSNRHRFTCSLDREKSFFGVCCGSI